ncbi:MAG: hypothetical protein ACREOO_23790 [bacterium]
MKTRPSFILLAVSCLPLYAQTTSSPRATATGGYIAAATDVYSVEWNMAATALGTAKIEAAFGIIERTGFMCENSLDNYHLLLRLADRHAAAIFRTGAYGIDHHAFPRSFFTNRGERTPLDNPHALFHEWGWGLGYAYQVRPQIAFGLDVRQHTYSNTFTSNEFWSLSLSFAHRPNDWLSLGAVFRNIANHNYDKPENSLRYGTRNGETRTIGISLPSYQTIRTSPERGMEAGIALKPVEELLLTFDYYSNKEYATGFEWRPSGWLALRMSASNKEDQLLQRDGFLFDSRVFGLAWGTGIKFKSVAVDFAYYKPYGNKDSVIDTPSTGEIWISPIRNDLVMLSFGLGF